MSTNNKCKRRNEKQRMRKHAMKYDQNWLVVSHCMCAIDGKCIFTWSESVAISTSSSK